MASFLTADSGRLVIIGSVICVSTGLRMTTFWEIKLVFAENCTDPFGFLTIGADSLLFDARYQLYEHYVVPTVEVFVPFAILLILNFGILKHLRLVLPYSEQ